MSDAQKRDDANHTSEKKRVDADIAERRKRYSSDSKKTVTKKPKTGMERLMDFFTGNWNS